MHKFINKRYKLIIFCLSLGLYIFSPFKSSPCLNGLPLGNPIDTFFILFLVFIFFILGWREKPLIKPARVIILLIVLVTLKFLLNSLAVEHGLKGYYYNNKDFAAPHAKSIEYLDLDATRIDKDISFFNNGDSLRKKPFNMGFINDHNIENFDFSIVWTGFLYLPEATLAEISVKSSGDFQLYLDRRLFIKGNQEELTRAASLEEGFHSIKIEYINKSIQDGSLDLKWSNGGKVRTISSGYLYPEKPSPAAFILDRYVRGISWIFFVIQFLPLLLCMRYFIERPRLRSFLRDEKTLLFLFFVIFLTQGFFAQLKNFRDPYYNILSRGNDWLVFEQHARLIVSGDWLDSTAAPFYFVPFYRYFIALVHLVYGEALFMLFWMQHSLLLLSCIFIYKIAKIVFNRNVAVLSLFFLAFNRLPLGEANRLLSAMLAMFLSCVSIYYLITSLKRRALKRMVTAGIFFGLSVITRPNLLTYIFFAVPWIFAFFFKEKIKLAAKYAFVFLFATMLAISCVAMRNLYTSGKFVLLTSTVGINLLEGNPLPPSINLDSVGENKVYKFFGLDSNTRSVLEYFRQEPLRFIKGLGIKVGYMAGIDPYNWGSQDKFNLDRFLVFLLFLVGFLWAMRLGHYNFRGISFALGVFPLLVILTLSLIKTWVYGWRLQLPALPFMLLFVAFLIDGLWKKQIEFNNKFFYIKYVLVLILFSLISASKFIPFVAVVYFIYYYLTYREKRYTT